MNETQSLEQRLGIGRRPRLDFTAQWEDPVASEHTDLDAVPEAACIDFGNGVVRECSTAFIIKRAMVDPDATVLPDDGDD